MWNEGPVNTLTVRKDEKYRYVGLVTIFLIFTLTI